MKHVCATLCILIFAATAVQAQDCPTAETPLQAFYAQNNPYSKTNDHVALAASDLSIEQQIVCITGKTLLTTDRIFADGPFYSALEEIWQGNEWVVNSKIEYEYNDDDRMISNLFLRWNAGTQAFDEESVTFFNYDENTSEVVTQIWNGSEFENQYRSFFERDAFDNTTRIERSDWLDGEWKTRFLSTSVVENGLITEITIQTIHNSQEVLDNALRFTFEYDGDGREVVEIEEDWDENTQNWQLEARELTSYPSANTSVVLHQNYQGGDWVDFVETTIVYNDQGLEVEWTSISLMEDKNGLRFLSEFNEDGHLIGIVTQVEDGMGGWINQWQQAFTLDQDGDPVVLLMQMYNVDAMEWENVTRINYNYQQGEKATSIEEEMMPGLASFDVYPYPATDRVNVSLQLTQASDVSVEVYDILGRRVANLTEGMAAAGIQQLSWLPQNEPAGLYFIRLSIDGAVNTKSLVLVK